MAILFSPEKPIHVVSYQRFVDGKWQDVCSHFRSYPNR
jgi:hypothetical protein